MAEKITITEKMAITEVEALNAALEFVPETETVIREKLEHMVEVRSRKRERKADDSKRLANVALGEKFVEAWEGDTFKAADVAAVLEVSKPKANAICKAMGWEEVPTTEKVKVYTL